MNVRGGRKLIIALGSLLGLMTLMLILASRHIQEILNTAVTARLAKFSEFSVKSGRITPGLSTVHMDQAMIHPAGHEDGPGLLLTGIHVKPNLMALIQGTLQFDEIHVDRASLLSPWTMSLENIQASMEPQKDKGYRLHFASLAQAGQLSGAMEWQSSPSGITVSGTLRGEALHFFHPKIARSPLTPLDFTVDFGGSYQKVQDELRIDEVRWLSRGLEAVLSGQVQQLKNKPRFDLSLNIPSVPCQTLLDAPPPAFVQDLSGFKLAGHFAAQLHLTLDFDKLDDSQLTGYRGFRDCQIIQAPPHLTRDYLAGSWQHTTRLTAGNNQTFLVGPKNLHYVPFSQFSEALQGAFLATEDISFFRHKGFVAESLSLAIGHNILENRFAMGGSTITMQMVKNVFLNHEKTLSRKIQELFLTDYVERTLGKERIFEIYLNVIEFGPGIFGIGSAAQHYFKKPAAALTPLEAVYLASIVYSPRRHINSYCRGSISKEWDGRLRQLLQLMHDQELISEEDFQESQSQSLVFRKPAVGCPNSSEGSMDL